MKYLKMFILLFLFSNSVLAEGFGISMDKDYYFKKISDNDLEIIVTNDSSKLLFANIFLYEGKPDSATGKIAFDYKDTVLGYDIYPEQIAIPAGQKRKVKLIRALKSAPPLGKEAYYRVRVIPKSPEDAIKANPQLLHLLTDSEKQNLEDSDKTEGALKVFIGSGSVLVVQNDFDITKKDISVGLKIINEDIVFKISNKSDKTIYFSKTKIFAKDKWFTLGDFAIRGGKTKELSVSQTELSKNGMSQGKIERLVFTSQSGKEININI